MEIWEIYKVVVLYTWIYINYYGTALSRLTKVKLLEIRVFFYVYKKSQLYISRCKGCTYLWFSKYIFILICIDVCIYFSDSALFISVRMFLYLIRQLKIDRVHIGLTFFLSQITTSVKRHNNHDSSYFWIP